MSVSAKSLRVERIRSEAARQYLDRHHPLGAGNPAFKFALGVFLDGRLMGVMTVGGPGTNNAGSTWGLRQHELFELRKMHLSDECPRNSESRVLAILALLIRKHYPAIKAIITYCDTEEKAAAYKAAGWVQGKSNRYVREVKVNGRWVSVREGNRLGLTAKATDRKYESRCKWFLPLDPGLTTAPMGNRKIGRQASGLKIEN